MISPIADVLYNPLIAVRVLLTWAVLALWGSAAAGAREDSLVEVAARTGASLVAVGAVRPGAREGDSPLPSRFLGTGFSVGDGRYIATSLHVVAQPLADTERLAVFSGQGQRMELRSATVERRDDVHDLALLRIAGTALPPLPLSGTEVPVGTEVAFSGFPLGLSTGIYPVTHRGIVSAFTPLASPVSRGEELSAAYMRALRGGFMVYQLDGTILPGHSGSPVYDIRSGKVLAVAMAALNLRAKSGDESRASGISYAVPAEYVEALLAAVSGE